MPDVARFAFVDCHEQVGKMQMRVDSIRARCGDSEVGMPFCGLWRFRDGRILEHWENAYDIAALDAFMRGEAGEESSWVRH